MLKTNFPVVVSAPSGAGKTTLINKLLPDDNSCEFVISTTNRTIREGEVEGKSYYFISEEDFKRKIDKKEFLEWSIVHRNYYGITKKEFDRIIGIGKIPLFDVDVQGAKKLKKILKNAIYIFIVPPTIELLKDRLVKRGSDGEEVINIRIKNAIKELKELNNYDYVIINDKIETALQDLKAILRAELCKNNSRSLKYKTKEN